MRVLRSIVQSPVRKVFDARHNCPLRCTVRPQLVGHYTRRAALRFQELVHQTLCLLGIAVALHQHIENKAVLVNGAPKPVSLSLDSDDNLIKVPFFPGACR